MSNFANLKNMWEQKSQQAPEIKHEPKPQEKSVKKEQQGMPAELRKVSDNEIKIDKIIEGTKVEETDGSHRKTVSEMAQNLESQASMKGKPMMGVPMFGAPQPARVIPVPVKIQGDKAEVVIESENVSYRDSKKNLEMLFEKKRTDEEKRLKKEELQEVNEDEKKENEESREQGDKKSETEGEKKEQGGQKNEQEVEIGKEEASNLNLRGQKKSQRTTLGDFDDA